MHMFVETKRSVWPRSDSCQGARGEKEQHSETRLAKRGQQTPLGCLILKPHSCLMQFLEEHMLSVPIPCINTWAWKNKLMCTCMIHRLGDQPTSWQAACGCENFVTPTRLALFTDGLKNGTWKSGFHQISGGKGVELISTRQFLLSVWQEPQGSSFQQLPALLLTWDQKQ